MSDRDAAFRGMFDLTSRLAALRPGRRDEALLRSLAGRPERVDRLLAVFSGVEPPQRYFRPADLARTLGWAGLADVFGLRPARAR